MGVSGTGTFGNVYSYGYVTALSDIRYKNVLKHFTLDIEVIAKASIIQFTRKDLKDGRKYVGGIAQEWEKILPETVVKGKDDRLTMDYSVIDYVGMVSLSRKVVEQQQEIEALKTKAQEIDELKAKNEKLERRLARLEAMFAILGEEEG
jgi:hypothetical protein